MDEAPSPPPFAGAVAHAHTHIHVNTSSNECDNTLARFSSASACIVLFRIILRCTFLCSK